MLEACVEFVASVVNSLIFVSSIFAIFDSAVFLLCAQSICTNTTMAIIRTRARDVVESTVFSLISAITLTTDTSFMSDTTPVV